MATKKKVTNGVSRIKPAVATKEVPAEKTKKVKVIVLQHSITSQFLGKRGEQYEFVNSADAAHHFKTEEDAEAIAEMVGEHWEPVNEVVELPA